MSAEWKTAFNKLQELQKELDPEHLKVCYINEKGEEEILTVEELLKKPNPDCQIVKVVSGNNIKDIDKILDWELQSIKCAID